MRKLASIMLIVALTVVAAGYGWLWFQTKRSADQAVAALMPFAEVHYDRVYVWPRGEVGVQGVSITPRQLGETIHIEALGTRAENLLELIKGMQALREQRNPEQIGGVVRGLRIDLDGRLMQMLEQASVEGGEMDWTGPLDSLACGETRRIGPQQLRDMGYRSLVADLGAEVYPDTAGETLRLKLDWEWRNMFMLSADTVIAINQKGLALHKALQMAPKLKEAHINYRDLGYHRRRNDYCAQQTRAETGDYLDAHVQAAARLLRQRNINPTPALEHAYRRLLEAGGDFSLSLRPTRPLDPSILAFYKPSDAVTMLQPTLYVAGETVDLSGLDPDRNTPVRQATARAQAPGSEPEQRGPRRPAFQAVELTQLANFVGHSARVQLRSGQLHEGVVEAIQGNRLILQRRVSGGSLSFGVDLAEVSRAEVWH